MKGLTKRGSGNKEIKCLFCALLILFTVFMAAPIFLLLGKSLEGEGSLLQNYAEILGRLKFWVAAGNSLLISCVSAAVTTLLAFLLAYSIHYTNLPVGFKRFIKQAAVLPMLLPTITYGFAIIYSFGKQGLITKILGRQPFEIYGFGGLLMGYCIYTFPVSFLLINNTMRFIDKKFALVSRVMGDKKAATFQIAVFRPLIGTFAASFIQCFFLCFTDYGIPASVGGKYEVVASVLYNEMLGSVPNFQNGAVIAVIMLLPSVVSILLLHYLEKYNIRYQKISEAEPLKNKVRDVCFFLYGCLLLLLLFSIFAVIVIIPFVRGWPYDLTVTADVVKQVLTDRGLLQVYQNSIWVAVFTALLGTLIAYGAALVTTRSTIGKKAKQAVEGIALTTNTIPGMVLGIAFLLTFKGSTLQNTLLLIILCNVVHFFSTPYLMLKNSLAKMNASWEQTAKLMGDSWFLTVARIITPNTLPALLEVFGYYFVNAMVTVSAVIFLAGARTMVITAKIKELQHFAKFNEIFVLSLLILCTNLGAKAVIASLHHLSSLKNKKRRKANEI